MTSSTFAHVAATQIFHFTCVHDVELGAVGGASAAANQRRPRL